MKFTCLISSALLLLSLRGTATTVTGHAIVTKRLTKKALSPTVYDLRGPVANSLSGEVERVNEFDRMAVILEATRPQQAQLESKPPVIEVLDQRGMRFHPDLVVVPIGSTIQFPNSDPIFHNIFSLSKANTFDLGYYPQGRSRTVTFTKAGIVQVYCHIHANMSAAIVVTASPWFEKPAADGSFSFASVPAGHYRLTAWHKIAGLYRVDVDVPETGTIDVSIHVPVETEP